MKHDAWCVVRYTRHRWGAGLRVRASLYIYVFRKKLTGVCLEIGLGMANYDPKKKKEYYLRNRDKRLDYQNEYYRRTKYSYARKLEVAKVLEPEEYEAFKKRVSDYNKEYYRKNKAKIMQKRRARKTALKPQ